MAGPTPNDVVGVGSVVVVRETTLTKRKSAMRYHSRMSFTSSHFPRFDPEVEKWDVVIPQKINCCLWVTNNALKSPAELATIAVGSLC